jgi:hypothetical protein
MAVMTLALGPLRSLGAYAQSGALPVPGNVQLWHFDDDNIQEYSEGTRVYFKFSYNGIRVLWDPSRQKLTKWLDSYASKLQETSSNLVRQEPHNLDPDTSIAVHIPSPADATSFFSYIELTFRDQFDGSFLLIAGQGRNMHEQRFCCDNPYKAIDSLLQRYDETVGVYADRLSDGRILLTVPAFDSSYHIQIYFIAIRAIPTTPLGFDRNVFLIPRSLIDLSLHAAGPALRARYAVVEHFMAAATEVKLSPPGQLVSAEEFFSSSQ